MPRFNPSAGKLAMSNAIHSWEVIGDVIVSLTTSGKVSDVQWKAWLKDLETSSVKKCIGATLGATELTSIQRKLASESTRDRNVKVAAVTDEALVRGIVTAASWLGAPIRAYSWSDMAGVMKYLNILPPLDQRIITWLEQGKRRALGG